MKLRDMGYLFVVYLTRLFIFAIFILSFILAYLIIVPKKDTTVVYLSKNPSVQREVAVKSNPGINTKFVAAWVKNFIIELYNFDMNDAADGKFIDKLKSKLLNPGSFKNNFLGQQWVQDVKNKNYVVSSIIDGAMISNSHGFLLSKQGEWNIRFPLWKSIVGQGVSVPAKEYGITVKIKQVPAEDAPLSGLKVVSVKDDQQ